MERREGLGCVLVGMIVENEVLLCRDSRHAQRILAKAPKPKRPRVDLKQSREKLTSVLEGTSGC